MTPDVDPNGATDGAPRRDVRVTARRRRIVRHLRREGTPVALASLARDLAAGERDDRSPASVAPEAVDRLAVRLHHVDLPKLVDADLLEYDPEGKVISLPGEPDRFR